MKAGRPLPDLAAELERRANVKRDFLAPANEMRLSILELLSFISNEDYREALLNKRLPGCPSLSYEQARRYWLDEFSQFGKGERAQIIGPVCTRIRAWLRDEFLQPVLCARTNTLDLRGLFNADEPRIILAHLDQASIGLEATRAFSSLLTLSLFNTAFRETAKRPVFVAIDEASAAERLIGPTIADVVTQARSAGIRLCFCTQHFSGISDSLREALLGSTAVQAYFRLSHADAKIAAASLGAGHSATVGELTVASSSVDRETQSPPLTSWSYLVRDAHGRPLSMNKDAWSKLWSATGTANHPLQKLRELASRKPHCRLYVQPDDSSTAVEVGCLVKGLSSREYALLGPRPLKLQVSFPKPKVSSVDRTSESDAVRAWTGALQELEPQHVIIRKGGRNPRKVKVVNVPDLVFDAEYEQYRSGVLQSSSQSSDEISKCRQWRYQEIDRLGGTESITQSQFNANFEEVSSDGSIA